MCFAIPNRAWSETPRGVIGPDGRVDGAKFGAMTLQDYPGFADLAPSIRGLLIRAEDGDLGVRSELLERIAEITNVFVGLELLEFVFMPTAEEDAPTPAFVDLIAPAESEPSSIAWFRVAEAGYDEFRDKVTLFGEMTEILNPPIVLDIDEPLS